MLGGKSSNLSRTIDRNVGSKATTPAMDKATRTAVGSNNVPRPAPTRAQAARETPKTSVHPGSRAGLKDAKSTHLNQHGSGYLNPVHQTARLKDRNQQIQVSIDNRTISRQKINRTYDSRLTSSKKSSISLMNKRSAR